MWDRHCMQPLQNNDNNNNNNNKSSRQPTQLINLSTLLPFIYKIHTYKLDMANNFVTRVIIQFFFFRKNLDLDPLSHYL